MSHSTLHNDHPEHIRQRLDTLERANRELSWRITNWQEQFDDLDPGYYLLTREGEFIGPAASERAACACLDESAGQPCCLVQVLSRHEGTPDDDDGLDLYAGMVMPGHLFGHPGHRPALGLAC